MKQVVTKGLAVALSLGLCVSLLPTDTFAAESAEADQASATESSAADTNAAKTESTEAGQASAEVSAATDSLSDSPDVIFFSSGVFDLTPVTEEPTEDETMNYDSLDSTTGYCALKSGNYVRYIDRMDVPEWAVAFYNQMIEGADNDGENDFLITREAPGGDTDYLIVEYGTFTEAQLNDDTVWAELEAQIDENIEYFKAIFQAFDRDYPECFWDTGYSYRTYAPSNGDGTYTLTSYLYLPYGVADDYTTETIKEDIAIRDQQVAMITAGAPKDAEYKVKYFNEWLCANNQYNTQVSSGKTYAEVDNNRVWECISALKGQTGETGPVCEAYARAMKVLCDAAGIPCVLCDGANHMWNYIEIQGTWYANDTTWNDTQGVHTRYLLVGGDTVLRGSTFLAKHPVVNKWYVSGMSCTNGPELSSTAFDWSKHEHTLMDPVTENVIAEPTCTAAASYDVVTYCSGCGEEVSRETIVTAEKLAHTYTREVTTAATPYEEGVMTFTCTGCGKTYTHTIAKIVMKTPTVTVSAAAGSSTRKIVFTGCFDDYANIADYYDITAHGILYMTTARLGTRELTTTTSGRTKVTFGAYKDDGSFTYTIRATSATTEYTVRSFITYKAADGSEVTVYSDPITVSYNGLK